MKLNEKINENKLKSNKHDNDNKMKQIIAKHSSILMVHFYLNKMYSNEI